MVPPLPVPTAVSPLSLWQYMYLPSHALVAVTAAGDATPGRPTDVSPAPNHDQSTTQMTAHDDVSIVTAP